MKLHLLLLASICNLSSGLFMAELKGELVEGEACTGEEFTEFADFKQCAAQGRAEVDPGLPVLAGLEEGAFVNRGGGQNRKLVNLCTGCTGEEPLGTYCFSVCDPRRRLEEGTDTPNLRRLAKPDFTAVCKDGEACTGNGSAKKTAEAIMLCLEEASVNHPCFGSTKEMTLTVSL